MASEGPLACNTAADDSGVGTEAWTDPTNIEVDDGNYAVAGNVLGAYTTHYLTATNFKFSILAGSTINGIVVEWQRHTPIGTVTDHNIRIIKGGVIGATELGSGAAWPSVDTYASFGGAANLCGETWTAAQIDATDFGCALSCDGNTNQAYVQYVRVTVYYTATGFDPAAGAGAFFRSQTRVVPARHTNRSAVSAGVLEMSLVTEPTRAFFVAGKSAPPRTVQPRGTKVFRPDEVPPDQLPPLGWKMQTRGQAPRGPWVPNRSTFRIPLEQTPPFPDSWLTTNRRVVNEPVRGRPRTWFALPLERFAPNPDSWLTITRKGVLPPPRPGRTQTWTVLKSFDFPLASVLGRGVMPGRPGSTRFAFVHAFPDALPSVVMSRGVRPLVRAASSIRFVPFLTQEAADISALFLRAGRPAITPRPRPSLITSILESTSTSILTLGWLKPFVARPLVSFGRPSNSTRIVWVPQTISTAFRQDNRNARGRSGNNQTGTALPSRNQTGTGNT